ncbi:MAG: hypothetical protein JEZ07_06625, partial [Phycisphaerae bacterium]|nr:hypothetical protein [Phycisphaerae bacterium]
MKIIFAFVVVIGLLVLPTIAIAQDQQLTDEEVAQLKSLLAKKQANETKIIKDFDLDFYGFARLDSTWSNSDLTTAGGGSIALWADPETAANRNDDEFSMTARGTRLGVNIVGPGNDTVKTSGKIEYDFGLTGAENSNEPRMRHAYFQFDFPDKNFSILAGQTWDVISPLIPPTTNLSVMWDAGNVGYRRPQLRFTQKIPITDDAFIKLETAATRTIGQTNLDNEDTGDDSGLPSVQARISYTMPVCNDLPTTIGVSGQYGTEEYDVAAGTDSDVDFESWLVCFDMNMPITKEVNASGEFYTGTNTRTYFGGIGQGVTINGLDINEIDAMGGWFGLTYAPTPKWKFAGGYSIDTVDPDDLTNNGTAREMNSVAFVNTCYRPFKATIVGVEAAYHTTEWHENADGQ